MERRFPESVRLTKLQNEKRLPSNTEDGALEQSGEIESDSYKWKISPFMIPLLIVELVLSIVDFGSDFWSGFSLLKLKNQAWGIGSFVINWIPGVIGVIQIIANHRCDHIAKTILYSLASLLLCPLIPTFTFVYLLCKVPRTSMEEQSRDFKRNFQKLLSFVMLIRALEGCIESPLQLLYKTFLMFNGIIDFNFTKSTIAVQDLHGNSIPVPFFINFGISTLTLLKSVYSLNMPDFAKLSLDPSFWKNLHS